MEFLPQHEHTTLTIMPEYIRGLLVTLKVQHIKTHITQYTVLLLFTETKRSKKILSSSFLRVEWITIIGILARLATIGQVNKIIFREQCQVDKLVLAEKNTYIDISCFQCYDEENYPVLESRLYIWTKN